MRQRGIDDHDFGIGNRDAMRQALTGEIAVDQRRDAAELRAAGPHADIFGPVRHEQRDGIALAHAVREQPARIAVGAAIPLRIRELLAIRDKREFAAMFCRELLGDIPKRAIRVFHDRAAHLHGARGPREIS